ncbi:hypothetical protein [Thermoflavimicrobium daqui]|uniref:Helix-turn-helix domain-containing protein n=1 Tax=Thermoflavimicrobium daqui TaxID=2137476 RepID=A0A364K1R3_9BACL|nr:hypothetical protein [Thermoflavimicrobium daqui]RAL21957.1 hypothetical protein DL897_15340 [Thermoflavimicrobium daqui]
MTKRKRNTEYQREKRGSVTKEEYEKQRKKQKESKVDQLKVLIKEHPEASNYKLSKMLEVSEAYIRKLKKQIL